MTERLIINPRDQSELQPIIAKYAETAKDWEYSDAVTFLNRWAGIFKERFLDSIKIKGQPDLPDPVIGFDKMRVETLAAYTVNRNNHGLLFEINFNTVHMVENEIGELNWRYGQWGMLETLLHEMIHLKQQNFGKTPYKGGSNTHNAEFVDMAESFGLFPRPVTGSHWQPPGAPFTTLMAEYGIVMPPVNQEATKGNWFSFPTKTPKGRSTLSLWECFCTPPQKARVGKGEFHATCDICGLPFVRKR